MINNFAIWLNDFMEQQELTQEALAEKIGVSHVAISKWLRSLNSPDPRPLRRLSKVANINPVELFQICGYLPFQLPQQPKRTLRPKMLVILTQLEALDEPLLDLVAAQIRAVKLYANRSATVEKAPRRKPAA